MDEEQKRIVVIGAIIAFLVFSTLIVCTKSRKPSAGSKKGVESNEFAQEENFIKKQMAKKQAKSKPQQASSYSSPSQSYSSPIEGPKYSEARIAANKKILQEARKNQKKLISKDVEKVLKDPNAPPAKLLRARLITSKSYVNAYSAYKKEDYKSAIKSYHEVFKDKESTVEMKYIALEGLQKSAKKIGDLDLYLIATQELGKLIMANDIPLLSVEKSPDYYEWALKLTTYMQARKNDSIKEKLISDAMKNQLISRKVAEKMTNEIIAEYEILFKELIN
jgi:hypothetical protein